MTLVVPGAHRHRLLFDEDHHKELYYRALVSKTILV